MINNRIAYLVSKKLSGEINDLEIIELNDALLADSTLYLLIATLEQSWQTNHTSGLLTPQETKRILEKIQSAEMRENANPLQTPISNSPQPHGLRRNFYRFGIAAALLAAFGLWLLLNPSESPKSEASPPLNEVTTKAGSKTRIALPDGTIVWLNGDSKLTYSSFFKGNIREVNLSGEGYFKVVSNKQRPFIIHGEKITITVTGTIFNVRDYPGESKAEASLISGKVAVSSNKNPKKIYYLNPAEKIVFKEELSLELPINPIPKSNTISPPLVDISPLQLNKMDTIPVEAAWVNNQLAFSNETFREVANKMEKWYGVTIHFQSPQLEKQRFKGKFDKETLKEALEALQFTTPFHYKISGNEVTIYNH